MCSVCGPSGSRAAALTGARLPLTATDGLTQLVSVLLLIGSVQLVFSYFPLKPLLVESQASRTNVGAKKQDCVNKPSLSCSGRGGKVIGLKM